MEKSRLRRRVEFFKTTSDRHIEDLRYALAAYGRRWDLDMILEFTTTKATNTGQNDRERYEQQQRELLSLKDKYKRDVAILTKTIADIRSQAVVIERAQSKVQHIY